MHVGDVVMSVRYLRLAVFFSSSLFFGLAVTVFIVGVPEWERALYTWIHAAMPADSVRVWFVVTRLGSERFILLAGVVILALLPGRLVRHAWLWVAVVIAATWLEDVAKDLVGRPRPVSFRPGFPSGHTTTAAAFYFLLAYLTGTIVHRRWRPLAWLLAAVMVFAVALSRIALQAHWPLDTVGGAALGLTLATAAALWHQFHSCWEPHGVSRRWHAWMEWLDQRKDVAPLAFFAVLFIIPRFTDDHSVRDLVVDAGGLLILATGLTLRLWALARPGLVGSRDEPRSALVVSGPYAYVRHPIYIANVLVGVGIALIAENLLALVVIPSMMCMFYRLVVHVEEATFRARWGREYDLYCAEVPRWFPRHAPKVPVSGDRMTWAAVRRDYRALMVTAALVMWAEITHALSHLLR